MNGEILVEVPGDLNRRRSGCFFKHRINCWSKPRFEAS